MEQHGLGPFCLELHSNKAGKGDVLEQLDRAWTTREELEPGKWERRADELKAAREKLNRLVRALHRRHANDMTLHQAIGRVVRDQEGVAVRLGWAGTLRHDTAGMGGGGPPPPPDSTCTIGATPTLLTPLLMSAAASGRPDGSRTF